MFRRAPKKNDNTRYYEMLLKRDGFKAKPALLTLVGSVVASGHMSLKSLVPCLVEALSNDDWATRKAAVETLVVVANVERDFLSELKTECVRVFENRRFDKVKLVRDLMNQMLEAWKQILMFWMKLRHLLNHNLLLKESEALVEEVPIPPKCFRSGSSSKRSRAAEVHNLSEKL